MSQMQTISYEEAKRLLEAIIEHKRPATVDWVNRSIVILSDEITDTRVTTSTGPLKAFEYLFRLKTEDER